MQPNKNFLSQNRIPFFVTAQQWYIQKITFTSGATVTGFESHEAVNLCTPDIFLEI